MKQALEYEEWKSTRHNKKLNRSKSAKSRNVSNKRNDSINKNRDDDAAGTLRAVLAKNYQEMIRVHGKVA